VPTACTMGTPIALTIDSTEELRGREPKNREFDSWSSLAVSPTSCMAICTAYDRLASGASRPMIPSVCSGRVGMARTPPAIRRASL
jgi:hypothetical protein